MLFFLLGSLLILETGAARAAPQVKIQLTADEKEWLKRHPRIQVGIMDAWPPLNYLDQNKSPQGIGAEYLAALNRRLGGALVPVPAPFKANYERVQHGQLDALMDITQRPDREALFNFTRPYIVIPHVIVGRKGGSYFKAEQDLAGRTIALERGFHNVTHFRNNFPEVKVREYASTSEALDAVSRGEAEAYAGNRAVVVHLIEKELLNNLRLMGKLTEPKSTLQIGVHKGQPLLAAILDKALASLTIEEERSIRQKWLQETSPGLDLTTAEQAWLNAHPTIRVALDPAWAPVEFLDTHGIPQGISPEYLKKIGALLGIRFEVAKGQEWPALVEGVRNRTLDIFSAQLPTEERRSYLEFTDAYLSLPIGIFTRQDAQYIVSMDDLSGMKVGVVKAHAVEQLLMSRHPDLRLVPAATVAVALQMLAQGEVDAVVDSTLSTGYYLNQLALANIKLAGETPFRYELSMGIRSDWPELTTILNKALRAIPDSERDTLYHKWVSLQFKQNVDYSLIWKVVAGALAVIALFVFWNRRLEKEIAIRKQAEEQLQANQARLEQLLEERTKTGQMLIERESQYRDLVESANSVILRWRPDGRITFFNRFAQSFFGYGEEEIINRNIVGTVVPAEDSVGHDLTSLAANIVAHPEAYVRSENENIRKNGERVWVAWTNKPIPDADGNIAEILSIGVDITQLVHTERELRRTLDDLAVAKERAEAADHLKSAFLATMSHELRTPLNSIIGFTGILLQGLGGPLNEEQNKQLTMVKSSASHLLSLISDVLDISKIEAGQLKVSVETFNLQESVLKVVQSVRPLAEKKGLDLTLDVAGDVGSVCADERRVEQILLNLLSNAVKFTEQGSISVKCFREAGFYVTAVTDTGIGIREDDLEHLFKPFHQIDSGLSRRYEGTGLGLSICKKMAELMGGSIRVESSPGKGSTFAFTLPP